ncbi:hypothetical protein BGZ51_002270 [Haplosporangium sp. Z 767]|nr:hypothetical protein BGZ51_002270 [Haplosporangium sp. Z 767]
MKFTTISAVLCLVAPAALANKHETRYSDAVGKRGVIQHHEIGDVKMPQGQPMEYQVQKSHQHREHGLEAHRDGEFMGYDDSYSFEQRGEDDKDKDKKGKEGKKGQEDVKGNDEGQKETKMGGDDEDKKDDGAKEKKSGEDENNKDVVDDKKGVEGAVDNNEGKDAAKVEPNNGKTGPVDDSKIPRDFASPLWIVQPYGASVWEQGRAYVISWGPNPDPAYAKVLKAKSPIKIRLMQGPHNNLREVAVLQVNADSSLNSFQWTVPATIPPANDYAIRLSHPGNLDAYSHYFEVVKAGDPRSSKSNVGEPLLMPQADGVSRSSDKGTKGTIFKPASPPNPFPAGGKPVPFNPVPATAPVGTKPAAHSGAMGETQQNANMLAFALTLFGAVYLL